jgi:hypothetical protein
MLPIYFSRKDTINKTIFNIEDSLGGRESSPASWRHPSPSCTPVAPLNPLPLGSSHCPWACTGRSWNHCMMTRAMVFISICLLRIEELATQLEEPL